MAGSSIVASRYAQSLIQLAREQQQLDAVNDDMKALYHAYKENADLRAFLKSPVIPVHKKEAALDAVFKGKVTQLTSLFMRKLVDSRREALLGEIASSFNTLYKEISGVLTVHVKSAAPLSASIREDILALVKKNPEYAKYNHIELEEKVDRALIGGLIITVGDKQVDSSFSRQISDFKKAFRENPYIVNY